jgi:hypothetical protein
MEVNSRLVEMGLAARRKMEREYSLKEMTAQYACVYTEMAGLTGKRYNLL